MEHEHFWSVSVCLTCSDEKSGKELIEQTRLQTIQEAIDVVEGMQEMHNHNSIPNLVDELEKGCVTCVKNQACNEVIKKLEEMGED